LGLAHVAFAHKDWKRAQELYGKIVEELPNADAAQEALYWRGVARYKASGDAAALGETAQQFKKKYPQSTWAKKASVWAA
jgi:outer membrane protein assembly factor BamD (BamD/ComL family)